MIMSIVEESAHGTKVLRTDLLKNIVLPVPPRVEQDEIVEEVSRVTQKTDRMAEAVLSVVDRLKEYRSTMITQVVTGKIDVRNVKVPETAAKGKTA